MKGARTVWLAPAYLLHQYAYRDSSRITEMFTREHGRVSLFARGARAPKSALRAGLRPFQRLLVSFTAKSEAGQLTALEIDGAVTQLPPAHLMSGFYLNELLLKLTERWDSHPELFECYAQALNALHTTDSAARPLRAFEKRLLEELGYGVDFSTTDQHESVHADLHYRVLAHRAISRCGADVPGAISGRSLIEMASESFASIETLRDAKRIFRASIDACLDGRPLGSREVMMALQRREQG